MKQSMEKPFFNTDQAIDLISAVKELHQFSPQQLIKILRECDGFLIRYVSENGAYKQIDVEKLARLLPLHLLAVIMSSDRDAVQFKYLLCGFRLLSSLCNLATRQPKLEQILLDDVKVVDQLLDLVIYTLIVLSAHRQDFCSSSEMQILHSSLLTCSLHMLSECISSQWHDIVRVLLAHSKVDIFMDAAFGAISVNVRSLKIKLATEHSNLSRVSDANIRYLFLQCEASINFLHSLCQQKSFRECLVRNKELSSKGGILFLARSILKLRFSPLDMESSSILSSVSRLKSKILSIILHLCEVESILYLDEVASSQESMELAKSVALEVLELMKAAIGRGFNSAHPCCNGTYTTGVLQVNALRLVDVFSDDSNFRYFVTVNFTEFFASIFLLPHGEFLYCWCSSELLLTEEVTVQDFDPYVAAGWILNSLVPPSIPNTSCLESRSINNKSQASYVRQKTALLVKVIANLHCFISDVCEEQERNLFLHKFIKCVVVEQPKSSSGYVLVDDSKKASIVCKNLCSLLDHAESLIADFLIADDVHLLRVFINQIQSLLLPDGLSENQYQASQSARGNTSPVLRNTASDFCDSSQINGVSENLQNEESGQILNSKVLEEADHWIESYVMDSTRCDVVIEKDKLNSGSTGSDSSFTKGNHYVDMREKSEVFKQGEYASDHGANRCPENKNSGAALCREKRKRKRTIMNDKQITLMERALLDEPEMQRNSTLLQSWADKLSSLGSEITSSQLKNWLNNRKAKLARAAKDFRPQADPHNAAYCNPDEPAKGPVYDSFSSSPGDDFYMMAPNATGNHQNAIKNGISRDVITEKTIFRQ